MTIRDSIRKGLAGLVVAGSLAGSPGEASVYDHVVSQFDSLEKVQEVLENQKDARADIRNKAVKKVPEIAKDAIVNYHPDEAIRDSVEKEKAEDLEPERVKEGIELAQRVPLENAVNLYYTYPTEFAASIPDKFLDDIALTKPIIEHAKTPEDRKLIQRHSDVRDLERIADDYKQGAALDDKSEERLMKNVANYVANESAKAVKDTYSGSIASAVANIAKLTVARGKMPRQYIIDNAGEIVGEAEKAYGKFVDENGGRDIREYTRHAIAEIATGKDAKKVQEVLGSVYAAKEGKLKFK